MTAIDHHLYTHQDRSEKRGGKSQDHKVNSPSGQHSDEIIRTQSLTPQDLEDLNRMIETLRQPAYRELMQTLETLLIRLLQRCYSTAALSCRQEQDIVHARSELTLQLVNNQYLNVYFENTLQIAYANARYSAHRLSALALQRLPETCPFLPEQILDQNFLPGKIL